MQTIYLTDNGVILKKKSNRILLKKDNKVMDEIPIIDIKRIIIFGNNQLSTDLMKYLSSKGIEVAFLSTYGKFAFRIIPETSKNIYLRIAQHSLFQNDDFRISWSKIIIGAKLKNQKNFLIRNKKNQPEINIKHNIDALNACIEKVKNQESIEKIMGVEG
ncbi:MAG: CRISPR-associated endonuclease Cas1 [Desulfobacterales bacterium]|nr:CRISPR-associated endonuclease Cas1 [Desulfobacterales bacterium]